MAEISQILSVNEAELYVQVLQRNKIQDLGNSKWQDNHDKIERLNMQALANATLNTDEFVKELIISYEKIPILIHDLLTNELWRSKVLPIILQSKFKPASTLPVYMVIFHEVSLISLLETIMFYKESCEAAGDNLIDLVDYCHRQITYLVSSQDQNMDEFCATNSSIQELVCQGQVISLPLSVMTRILNTHDIPVVLVQLAEKPPWVKRDTKGQLQKFIDGKWKNLPDAERFQVTKSDGQVWLSLYHLLMNPECRRKYEFNTYNKTQILKLRGLMNEILLDQIPNLIDLQKFIEQLAVVDPPIAKKDLVLEQIPEIREKLLKDNKNKWNKIAQHQMSGWLNPSGKQLMNQAKLWADTYNIDSLEGLIAEPPKCANCAELASKRCSRCRNEWYCKRECQVKHWAKHKASCNLMAEVNKT
ncbi:zinc finger MYND domain-containing protein 10-like isoform X2 [Xenia sp. Carnegie-2017]|uniref:zinc finger MYND domain-containing protein 10-like isoform X2 n=1 Tax=Xenia sp. Carnegie-2017 TaxID=2897299 RepID=UPI001F047E67|nr:zinc finger MYND domain-containing protein 10-like isoform X2 [Xenia sp. Carnegie-2017]